MHAAPSASKKSFCVSMSTMMRFRRNVIIGLIIFRAFPLAVRIRLSVLLLLRLEAQRALKMLSDGMGGGFSPNFPQYPIFCDFLVDWTRRVW